MTLLQKMTLHHVGIVTADLSRAVQLYRDMGYTAVKTVEDPVQVAAIALMQRPGEPIIELIAPQGPASPAYSWLRRITAGAYHICYTTDSITAILPELQQHGFALIMRPVPAIAFDNRQVAFLWSPLTGLVELVEA